MQFYEHPNLDLEKLYTLALTKDLVNESLGCFGYFGGESDPICKSCYLGINQTCQNYKVYLEWLQNLESYTENTVKVCVFEGIDMSFDTESKTTILNKLKFRPSSTYYKIASLILDSNNKPYGDVMNDIVNIIPNKSILTARVRFSHVKKRFKANADLDLKVVTQKFLSICKFIKEV
jgi:hypothetical protein